MAGKSSFVSCLDLPASGVIPDGARTVTFRGWIASEGAATLEKPVLVIDDKESVSLAVVDRPDVIRAYPRYRVLGFHQEIPTATIPRNGSIAVQFKIDGDTGRMELPQLRRSGSTESVEGAVALKAAAPAVAPFPDPAPDFQERKQRKLKRLEHILACPQCGGEHLDKQARLLCTGCGAQYSRSDSNFNFLSPELRNYGSLQATENVSAHQYDGIALDIIAQHREGLVLDCGSGFRSEYYDNVVNFEIVDYPSTDVLGIGEKLPFRSNAFDAVFSLAVLEHVRFPFECAREIARVLKPGGRLYVVVPFLQPFHGYPNHYYNMTGAGLRNLFEDHLEIEKFGVPRSGVPIWCLTWFLNSYVGGLPSQVAEKFKELKVADLLDDARTYLAQDFVRQLSPQATETLASTNYLLARKPERKD